VSTVLAAGDTLGVLIDSDEGEDGWGSGDGDELAVDFKAIEREAKKKAREADRAARAVERENRAKEKKEKVGLGAKKV
jgi:hypothetical protein